MFNAPEHNRVLIVDVSHIAYTHSRVRQQLYARHPSLGQVNTTVQTGIVKNVVKWSNGGDWPTLVCFDRPCPQRKEFMAQNFGMKYKSSRTNKSPAIYQALDSALEILQEGGVPCLALPGYEADDLIGIAVESAKLQYPDRWIDVVTGDTDLVPLVDDQVSVFLRSYQGTSSVHGIAEKNKYAQITPETYTDIVTSRSDFKNLNIPYNMLLMAKLLRGDKGDEIPSKAKKLFPPKKFNAFIEYCHQQGVTEARYTPESYYEIMEVLEGYVDDQEILDHISLCWQMMCLNFPYESIPGEPPRAQLGTFTFGDYNLGQLQRACTPYQINLPVRF